MSLTVTKEEGRVTVTVTSDPESYWPPLCQILQNMCHILWRIDVSQCLSCHLDVRQQKLLGGLQMLVGVLGMFLVASLEDGHHGTASKVTWLGFVVILSVVTNIVAATMALCGIGLYFMDLDGILEVVLIILAVQQILVNISAAVFGMAAMRHNRNTEKEDEESLLKVASVAVERSLQQIPEGKGQILIFPQ